MLFAGRAEREAQYERIFALGRGKVEVARTHRESVLLAHNRHRDDFDIEVQIEHHPLNRAQLLEVFFAENREVRLHDIEQLADHRRHAAEMAWAMPAA